jgi:hypothetical protein
MLEIVPAQKQEGGIDRVEELAIFLAVGFEVANPPIDRLDMLSIWEAKRESVRAGYRRRAERLLRMWGEMEVEG